MCARSDARMTVSEHSDAAQGYLGGCARHRLRARRRAGGALSRRRSLRRCAASGAACLTHPLDVSKVRMQTSASRSMLGTLVASVRRDGAPRRFSALLLGFKLRRTGLRRGAYAGLSASLLRQMTCTSPSHPFRARRKGLMLALCADSLTRFAVYDKVKLALRSPSEPVGHMAVWKLGAAASIAGAAGGLTGNPADIILVRMIGDVNKSPEKRLNYRNWCASMSSSSQVVLLTDAAQLSRPLPHRRR
jgi:hypothetical protein